MMSDDPTSAGKNCARVLEVSTQGTGRESSLSHTLFFFFSLYHTHTHTQTHTHSLHISDGNLGNGLDGTRV